jgi:acyl carrier protein
MIKMERDEVVKIMNEFLIEEIEVDEDVISPDAHIKDDLEIDSLDFVDIVVIIEKAFGFKIKQEEMVNVVKLDNFYDYIYSKVKDK